VQVGLEVVERPLKPGDVGVQAALKGLISDQAPPIGLRSEHLHELTPAGDELAQALGVFGGSGRTAGRTASAKRAMMWASKVSVLARVPVARAKSRIWRGLTTAIGRWALARVAATVASYPPWPRGRPAGVQGLQAGHQLGEPGLIVGDDEGVPGGADVDVEMILGDIEADEELVHDPSL
jgi:hypothetical protein